jgi:hypothetical protein
MLAKILATLSRVARPANFDLQRGADSGRPVSRLLLSRRRPQTLLLRSRLYDQGFSCGTRHRSRNKRHLENLRRRPRPFRGTDGSNPAPSAVESAESVASKSWIEDSGTDRWCDLGHVLYVLEGELDTELREAKIQAIAGNELSGFGRRRRPTPLVDANEHKAHYR